MNARLRWEHQDRLAAAQPPRQTRPAVPGKWIAVDLHGTLARYDASLVAADPLHVGHPIPEMVDRVKLWMAEGHEVRIFTAKIFPLWKVEPGIAHTAFIAFGHNEGDRLVKESLPAAAAIQAWSLKHLGRVLTLTCVKDRNCREVWDDKAVPVQKDVGAILYDDEREFT